MYLLFTIFVHLFLSCQFSHCFPFSLKWPLWSSVRSTKEKSFLFVSLLLHFFFRPRGGDKQTFSTLGGLKYLLPPEKRGFLEKTKPKARLISWENHPKRIKNNNSTLLFSATPSKINIKLFDAVGFHALTIWKQYSIQIFEHAHTGRQINKY